MIKLDDDLLKELGLDAIPKEEKSAFLRHMYETLEMRVGTRLAERMTEQQMLEFEQFINTGDEQGAFKWLEANFPNYKEVVAEEFEKLKNEVRQAAPQIVAASQTAAHQPQAVAPAAPMTSSSAPQSFQSPQSQSTAFDTVPVPSPQYAPQPQPQPWQQQPMAPQPQPVAAPPQYQPADNQQPQYQPYQPQPQSQQPVAPGAGQFQPLSNPYAAPQPPAPDGTQQEHGLAA